MKYAFNKQTVPQQSKGFMSIWHRCSVPTGNVGGSF